MLEFITKIVKDVQSVHLSKSCGKYYELVDNEEEILAFSFEGRYGYDQTPIEKLNAKTIKVIYEDLYKDFGD